VRIETGDGKGLEGLAQYVIRNPFSLAKMTYNEQSGMVIYRSKMTYGKNRKNFKVYGAGKFIAAITQHIPEKNYQLVRYYGWYSNRSRGARLKAGRQDGDDTPSAGVDVIAVVDYEPRRIPLTDSNKVIGLKLILLFHNIIPWMYAMGRITFPLNTSVFMEQNIFLLYRAA